MKSSCFIKKQKQTNKQVCSAFGYFNYVIFYKKIGNSCIINCCSILQCNAPEMDCVLLNMQIFHNFFLKFWNIYISEEI